MKNNSGFTLIEVIVVSVLIGIMTAIAIPNYINWLPNYRLKGAARDLYSNMQKARLIAVKENRNTAIEFDPANNRYSICDDWTGGAPCAGKSEIIDLNSVRSGVGFGHGNATVQANITASAFPLVPDDNVSFASNTVVFNSRGFGSPGYVYLDHQDNTVTYAVGSLSSGTVRIRKWQGGSWK